jgi:hypothetical protein
VTNEKQPGIFDHPDNIIGELKQYPVELKKKLEDQIKQDERDYISLVKRKEQTEQ